MLEQLIDQLNQEYSLPVLAPSENKQLYYLQAGKLKISLKPLNPGVLFYAHISPLFPQNQEKILTVVMKGNFLSQGTGNCVIGLTEDESFLTLELALPYEITYNAFKEHAEEFMNFLDFWSATLQKEMRTADEI